MHKAFLSMGSNIGDSYETLRQAVRLLAENKAIEAIQVSSFYVTKPVGYLEQPDFVNIAVCLQTKKTPEELLDVCQEIENRMGRERTIHWGPRTLDVDIILFDTITVSTDRLTIPHPRALERAFVLVPLLEIDQDLTIMGRSIQDICDTLEKSGIRKVVKDE